MKTLLKELASGFLIGIANIIPGVSGGTFLLILGMYQRVMSAISGLNAAAIKAVLGHGAGILFSSNRKENLKALGRLITEKDLFFLMRLGIGATAAIVILSDVMMYLLTKQFAGTYAFFFGLIIVSTIMSLRLIERFTFGRITMLILGIVATVAVTIAVNPADKIRTKSDHYREMFEKEQSYNNQETSADATKSLYAGVYTPAEYASGTMAGALGVSAMVLPGISGSLVLILVGQYYKVINAISSLRTFKIDYFIFLTLFAIGMFIGVLLFARLVTFVFKRFYNGTIAFLTGLMAGSLYTLWPFKSTIIMDQYVKSAEGISMLKDVMVRTNANILPKSAFELVVVLIMCGAGAAIMVVLGRYNEK